MSKHIDTQLIKFKMLLAITLWMKEVDDEQIH